MWKNGGLDLDAVWGGEWGRPRDWWIRLGSASSRGREALKVFLPVRSLCSSDERSTDLVNDGGQTVGERQRVGTEVADHRLVAAERRVVVASRVVDGRVQRRQIQLLHTDHHAETRP